ncbi:P-type conjugative transfer ATPase TrbB [Pseudoduganella ginsengisoli]|uniref:P-type conjugative transfer ATPase TrbB n=1 Tax=Pseudoduganella ginsengisoli TaxID=1462440 RepID=A0A6L6Q9N4_9BURK|nr:P-type conjugative transfer ATPase TrbB [Pseudoduganella ginsengisoli]MTW05908.1 P-type conjugative transfer ATPase TrbB [Pseudoduganella ginsengisoli]
MIDNEKDSGSNLQHQRNIEKLRRDLGPIFLDAFDNSFTIEIMLNPDGKLWHELLGKPMQLIGRVEPTRAEAVLKTVAACLSTTITRENPTIEGEFPLDGSRFAGQIAPVVKAPTYAIRKKASSIFTLDQYVESGVMSQEYADIIRDAVANHRNILVIGGTGSGKTTLTNAIIHEISVMYPHERVVIIEDTGELQCSAENHVLYHTSPTRSMTDLLKTTLRMRPERILIGEVRGHEALDLLDAWNTGHEGGVATLHANNSTAALKRLHSLVTRNPFAPKDIEPLIGEVVHLVIQIKKTPAGRRVTEILKVMGYEHGQYKTEIF